MARLAVHLGNLGIDDTILASKLSLALDAGTSASLPLLLRGDIVLYDIDDLGARIRKSLTMREMAELIEFAQRALYIHTEAQLKGLEPALKRLFDYRF